MNTLCITGILWGLGALLLILLCYAAYELIRILIALRIIAQRAEKLSDFSQLFAWFKRKQ